MNQLLSLSATDFKLIFRDPSLRFFLAMPILVIAFVLFAIPLLVENYEGAARFVPVLLMGSTIQTSTMFGFIYCMVLIHEKDIQVAKVYGVLPVLQSAYISARLLLPFALSATFTFLLLILQPFFQFKILHIILYSVVCGLLSPILTLSVTILSKNKMEGMTWFKLGNLLITIPLIAFFIPDKLSVALAIIPSHWVFQSLSRMILNQSPFWTILASVAFMLFLLVPLVQRFVKVHFV